MRKFAFSTSRLININTPSVWVLFNELAFKNSALNLVSGFPNWDPPDYLAPDPFFTKNDLLKTLSRHYSSVYERDLNGVKNFCLTPGATYAINIILYTFLSKEDEVVAFEPYFTEYHSNTILGGGIFKGVPLHPPPPRSKHLNQPIIFEKEKDEWKIDWQCLENTLSSKTRILILNNPNNPTGKVFTKEELERIADLIKPFPRIIVLSDEVYEHCFFEGVNEIKRFAKVSGMFERTISILSAGKAFAATGIRVGWAVAPPHLIEPLNHINSIFSGTLPQFLISSVNNAFLNANSNSFYELSRENYKKGRDQLISYINNSGNDFDFKFWIPQSGFFVLCDRDNVRFDERYQNYNLEKKDFSEKGKYTKDFAFAIWLALNKKIVGVPGSVFYSGDNKKRGEKLMRFACCKTIDSLKPLESYLK